MLLEEAAGLGKFKARRHRAELKLARVATQVERARDVEAEVRKRLRPLALQATAAERAEKLVGELARLRARVAQLDLVQRSTSASPRESSASRLSTLARRDLDAKLEALVRERNRVEDELADAAGKREQATAALYRLRSARERVADAARGGRSDCSDGCARSSSSLAACSTSASARSARRWASACGCSRSG